MPSTCTTEATCPTLTMGSSCGAVCVRGHGGVPRQQSEGGSTGLAMKATEGCYPRLLRYAHGPTGGHCKPRLCMPQPAAHQVHQGHPVAWHPTHAPTCTACTQSRCAPQARSPPQSGGCRSWAEAPAAGQVQLRARAQVRLGCWCLCCWRRGWWRDRRMQRCPALLPLPQHPAWKVRTCLRAHHVRNREPSGQPKISVKPAQQRAPPAPTSITHASIPLVPDRQSPAGDLILCSC